MKRYNWICFVVICFFLIPSIVNGDEPGKISHKKQYELKYKKDEIIVKYKSSRKSSSQKTFQKKSGFSTLKTYKKSGIKRLKIKGGMDIKQALEIYNSDPDVEYAEPNYVYRASLVPNDTHFDKQWALENVGQVINNQIGFIDADIDATEAWDITTGNSDVIVAVIDSGVDYNHPDLSANIWVNQNEIAGNGIDDDGNGRIDDIRGWDFVDSDNDPMDYSDHGTHVAGIIAAVSNNNNGVAGVAWSAKIMAIRGLDTTGYGYTSDLIEAIEYAGSNGADIINISWGGEDYSQALKDVIDSSTAIIICAAGNDGQNNDYTPHYPSGYNSSNIISVAATDQYDNLASFSNFGAASVDIGAPGANIYSTIPAKETIWSDNFDDGDMSGWTTGGTHNRWSVISSAYSSPSYSLAVTHYGIYENDTDSWARSPAFDLSYSTGARLEFEISGVSESYYDVLYVQASFDGSSWTDCEVIDGSSGGNWIDYTVDLKDFEGFSSVYIRFQFVSDESYNYEGFYIDNISVSAYSTSFSGIEYQYMDGTSMAAPFVSGVAGLIKAMSPDLAASEVKAVILDSVDIKSSLTGKVSSGGRLNTFNTLLNMIPCENEIFFNLPEFVTEGDGILTGGGFVSIESAIEENINIALSSDDNSEITVPSSVTIPAGQTSAAFDITIVDDGILDGAQIVNITFDKLGCPRKIGQILVYDSEAATLTVEIPETAYEGDGVLIEQGTVNTEVILGEDVTIYLYSNNTNKVTVPETLIIHEGQDSAVFDIKIIDDSINEGFQEVTITASVPGWNPGTDTIIIADNDKVSWIHKTFSTDLNCILRDDIRDRIYLADAGNNQLVIIDSQSLEVILRLPLDSGFSDMAISKDNSTMAVAGGTLFLVDLETFTPRQLNTEFDIFSVAFNHNGDLMLINSKDWGYVYHFDPDKEMVVNSFGAGLNLYDSIYDGLLKTNKDGGILYVAERQLYPASFYKFDISGETPVFIAQSGFNEIGDDLKDFVISTRHDEIYLAGEEPRGIEVIDSNTIEFIQLLETGTYSHPGGVASDLGDYYIYGLSAGFLYKDLYQFDSSNRELHFKYKLLNEESEDRPRDRGIAIDRSGQRAFVIHGDNNADDDPDTGHYKVQVIELNTHLSLYLPDSAFEGDGLLEGNGEIKLLKPPPDDLIIFLESDDDTEVSVPSSVMIPAGQVSVNFDLTILDDNILDGTRSVTIKASVSGYPSTEGGIDVNDNEQNTLHLTLPDTVLEGDGFLTGQGVITSSSPVDSDVKVQLILNDDSEINLSSIAIIKQGDDSTTFSFTVIDDLLIDGLQTTTISAVVEGWEYGIATIDVLDNDNFLIADIVPFFKEGDGNISNAGYVSIIDILDYDLVINLSSSDISEAVISENITIPAGRTTASFDLSIIDDEFIDGVQNLTIAATASNFIADTGIISIIDNENESLLPSWTTYQGNASHTGYISVPLSSSFKERWVKTLRSAGYNVLRPVTEANGRVFICTTNSLLVLMEENGETVWEKKYVDVSYVNPPAFNNGTVFVQITDGDDSDLRAYDAYTGSTLFQSQFGAQYQQYYAPTIYNDVVYVTGGGGGGAFAFDGISGERLWFIDLPQYDKWTPAVNEGYVFAYTTELSVINRQTGILEFAVSDPNFDWDGSSVYLAPVIGGDDNIIVIQNGRLINFDLTAKEIKWEINENYKLQPSVANNRVYAINSGILDVRNESDGSIIWSWNPPEGSLSQNIIITHSHIFAGTDNITYAIDKESKTEVWSYPAGGHLTLSEGALYIATDAGSLIAIDVFEDIDTDEDGIVDGVEDSNNNGIVDPGETDPLDADSDDDDILDGDEDVNHNGILDTGETDPLNIDTDNDGMPDGWEVEKGFDPLVDDAGEDADGDGYSNLEEYRRKTDPNDYNSQPSKGLPWLMLLLGDD